MRRRMVKRLLKNVCVLVGLGLVFLPSIFILLDLSLLATHQKAVTSQTIKIQQLQQFKRTVAEPNFLPEENFHTSRQQTDGKHHRETNAPQLQNCVQRDEETLYFYEILLGSVVYSAFLDNRLKDQAFIRVISILPSYGEQIQMYCHFQDQATDEYFTSVMEVEELGKSQGFSYLGFLGSCNIPKQIDTTLLCSVNISLQPEAHLQTVENTKVIPLHAANHRANTAAYQLCVTPMAGEISVARLVEFIELSQILGVSHFTFYNVKGTDRGILEVLKYYKFKGVATVLPWDLPYYMPANIFKLGREAAINDCLYRSIGKFAFVAVNAVDEYLLPVAEKNVLQMLEKIHKEDMAGHCFESYSFNTMNTINSQNSQTPLITQRFKFRAKASNRELSRCIVSPINIFSLDLNMLPNPLEEFYTIRQEESTIGYVFRYTNCGEECAETQEDLTMEKYREQLGTRFKGTMTELRIQRIA